jgi:methylamine utilization protein MauE
VTAAGWEIAVVSALIAAVLLSAGVAKVLSPGILMRSMAEVFPPFARLGPLPVRVFGSVECAIAISLLAGPARVPAAVAAAAAGVMFAILGSLGWATGSALPCGCFGAGSRRPLGWMNVATGAVLVLAGLAETTVRPVPAGPYSTAAALFTAVAVVGSGCWASRQLIRPLLRTRSVTAEG